MERRKSRVCGFFIEVGGSEGEIVERKYGVEMEASLGASRRKCLS